MSSCGRTEPILLPRIRSAPSAIATGSNVTRVPVGGSPTRDRKSTRLNSSHDQISYAVFCLKKKKQRDNKNRRHTLHDSETVLHRNARWRAHQHAVTTPALKTLCARPGRRRLIASRLAEEDA